MAKSYRESSIERVAKKVRSQLAQSQYFISMLLGKLRGK